MGWWGVVVGLVLHGASGTAVLEYTVPAYEPDTTWTQASGCPGSLVRFNRPEQPLTRRLQLWYAGEGADPIVWQKPVTPGATVLDTIPWDGRPATVALTTIDPAGNESCPPALLMLGSWATDVPLLEPPARTLWYDLSGRRVQPTVTGVYWRVDLDAAGRRLARRKVVIVR